MCGIYGIWHVAGQPVDLRALHTATVRLAHRGPDDEGYLLADTRTGTATAFAGRDSDKALGLAPLEHARPGPDLAFGFRRLAILDLSPAGHQPMASPDGRFWIVFNGEIYNYLELRAELEALGHAFRSGGDTEVLLAAYAAWGEACLDRLNGMWAFAIWDRRERTLFLARDRFGIKPLFYTNLGGTFAFASEIKALVGSHALPFRPDDHEIYRFLAAGALPSAQAGKTFFQSVHSLPPGHALTLRDGEIRLRRYWNLRLPEYKTPADERRVVDEYRALFADAVRLQLRADVAVGTCLSGGLDSSSIVCVVNQLMAGSGLSAAQIGARQKTFSAVYDGEARYNERRFVERVLHATGAEGNFTTPDAAGLAADLERLAWHQEEPFQSTSIYAQWCVMRLVHARGVTVLLDGQGADELLAGYRPFGYALLDMLRAARLAEATTAVLAMHARTELSLPDIAGHVADVVLPAQLRAALHYARRPERRPPAALRPDFAAAFQRRAYPAALPAQRGTLLDTHLRALVMEHSLPTLLRYEDRNSMAFGVEARVPFLDHRLAEFAFGPAARLRLRGGWTKWIHREALHGIVPGSIAWRSDKVGFETPERDWQRQLLAARNDLFADGALSGAYLDLPSVRRAAPAWLERGGDARLVWRWTSLESWLRVCRTL
jgi:asparagine synthase (glutamine-hydrolysing)